MRTYDKRTLKQSNRPLNEATQVKTWRDTSIVSLALLKNEGGIRCLYPIPSRGINNLDYNDNSERTMKAVFPSPLKITSFLYTTTAQQAVNNTFGDGSGLLVLITYFDFDVMPTYTQYVNTTKKEDRNNPQQYIGKNNTNHVDKTCIIIGVVSSPHV